MIFTVLMALLSYVSAKAESVIYVFDNYPYQLMDELSFNGEALPISERPFLREKNHLKEYKKGLTKYIIKNDGRLLIVRDFTWASKPYHDEITLDLNDGDVYYLELVSGIKSKVKLLKDNEGQKKLQKIASDETWIVFPNYEYVN